MSRGRPDCFSWDDVKIDKHRECYLGHSLNAPVGRWQKGRDILWWTKSKQGGDKNDAERRRRAEEMRRVKENDRQAIMEKLGMATKKRRTKTKLSESEMKELLRKGDTERDDTQAAERIDGLGASTSRYHDGRSKADKVAKLREMIASGMQRVAEGDDGEGGGSEDKPKAKLSASKMLEMAKAAVAKAKEAAEEDEDDEGARKALKKAKKAAKKAKKKAKKEAKKAKKAKKKESRKRRRGSDDSDSD
eukprot:CAMPEP_0185257122 /NCGR_PEP_ID=MMETSP1359-20130426/6198_1 /TAXON_ID=552665 /ORGANISM="Bigelowiella longifila, Strain CCMP242" /LENGTH=246 /DNA_ID=CAMNT_0027842059 /DNA_START=12 /DNA_END=752 /DNA_ORIENTATION=-